MFLSEPAIHSHENEVKKFTKIMGEEAVQDSFKAAVHFFETDHEALLKEMAESLNIYSKRIAKGVRE